MRLSSVSVPLLVAAALAAMARPSPACSCAPSDFDDEYTRSAAIFVGQVVDVSPVPVEYPLTVLVTVRVEYSWKGPPLETARIVTSSSSAACGFPFEVGTRYLVYAGATIEGELTTYLCSRTHATWAGDPDLELLNHPPAPPSGMSFRAGPNPSRDDTRFEWLVPSDAGPMPRVRLEVLDLTGRRVAMLVDEAVSPGPHESTWDGRDLRGRAAPGGIYLVRYTCAGRVLGRRIARIATGG